MVVCVHINIHLQINTCNHTHKYNVCMRKMKEESRMKNI